MKRKKSITWNKPRQKYPITHQFKAYEKLFNLAKVSIIDGKQMHKLYLNWSICKNQGFSFSGNNSFYISIHLTFHESRQLSESNNISFYRLRNRVLFIIISIHYEIDPCLFKNYWTVGVNFETVSMSLISVFFNFEKWKKNFFGADFFRKQTQTSWMKNKQIYTLFIYVLFFNYKCIYPFVKSNIFIKRKLSHTQNCKIK